jgi:RNA polymerase sigma-70 factor, ECF subfamily
MTARLELVSDSRSHELALVRRAASGDEVAFEQIYRDHAPRVFALCCRMTGSRERAAECVQDVFVQVWRRLADWRGDAALGTWIHRVTVNRVLSNVRTEQRRLIHEMPDSPEREPSPAELREPADDSRLDLERAIAGLPAGARTVFVLHDVEGYRHAEIASMTGTAEGTCRAQLHRARRLLMEARER